MSDKQIIALSLSAESLGIDSEPYFLSKLKSVEKSLKQLVIKDVQL